MDFAIVLMLASISTWLFLIGVTLQGILRVLNKFTVDGV